MHPSADYREVLAVIELKDDREIYLLLPEVARGNLPSEKVTRWSFSTQPLPGRASCICGRCDCRAGRTLQRVASIGGGSGRTRHAALDTREGQMALGAYEIYEAGATIPDPEWPDLPSGTAADRLYGPLVDRARPPRYSAAARAAKCSKHCRFASRGRRLRVRIRRPREGRRRAAATGLHGREGIAQRAVWRLWRGEFGPHHHSPSGPTSCSSPTMPAPSLGVSGRSAGRCRRASSTCSPNFEIAPMACQAGGSGLFGALAYFGLDTIGAQEKAEMRDLVLGGGPWWTSRRARSNSRLLREPTSWRSNGCCRRCCRASICRAHCCAAATWRRPPPWKHRRADRRADVDLLRQHWTDIQDELIADDRRRLWRVRRPHFQGRTIRELARRTSAFPGRDSKAAGSTLSDDTFRQMAKAYPAVSPLRELRSALRNCGSTIWRSDVTVATARSCRPSAPAPAAISRAILNSFRAERVVALTDQAATGPWRCLHRLVTTGIRHRRRTVRRSRPCWRPTSPAILTWRSPSRPARSRRTRPSRRTARRANCSKHCVLGMQYGMEAEALAARIGQPPIVARDLLRAHRETYRVFWRWSDAAVDHAMLHGSLHTVFGWHVHVGDNPQPAVAAKFPDAGQRRRDVAAGVLPGDRARHRGLRAGARRHADLRAARSLEADVARMRAAMAEASRIVLGGFEIRTDVARIRHPDRYLDPRGTMMWDHVTCANRQAAARGGGEKGSMTCRPMIRLNTERLRADPADPCLVVKRANVPAKITKRLRSIHQNAVALAREAGRRPRARRTAWRCICFTCTGRNSGKPVKLPNKSLRIDGVTSAIEMAGAGQAENLRVDPYRAAAAAGTYHPSDLT